MAAHESQVKENKSQLKSKLLDESKLSQYKIKGSEEEWKAALEAGKPQSLVSIKG